MTIIEIISTVGFPIAMVFYLMFRFEKTLNKNTETIDKLHYYLKNGRR